MRFFRYLPGRSLYHRVVEVLDRWDDMRPFDRLVPPRSVDKGKSGPNNSNWGKK